MFTYLITRLFLNKKIKFYNLYYFY